MAFSGMQNQCLCRCALPQMYYLHARRHSGKSRGRKMKVRGIANIHPRQLFMNIKEQLWMEAGSHHFLLIIFKHWNTLQLNGFIPSKSLQPSLTHCHKVSFNNIDSCTDLLCSESEEGKSGACAYWSFFFPSPPDAAVMDELFSTCRWRLGSVACAFEECSGKENQCWRSLCCLHFCCKAILLVLCSRRASPWQQMRKQMVLLETQTLGSTLI